MVPRVKMSMIKSDTSIADALHIMLKEGYSRYPIYEISKDEIIGVVHSKDIVSVYIQNNGKTLKDIMRQVHFIPETKPIDVLPFRKQSRLMFCCGISSALKRKWHL